MSDTMQLCPGCGVVRAQRHTSCPRCTTDYAGGLSVPYRPGGKYWVCIECSFKCRACGFRGPLNQLDMDGGVLCARCGLEQAFDVLQWGPALDRAQGTGDLWNESDPRRPSDLVALGDSRCSRTYTGRGENDFVVVSSPGQPLCEKCHKPVDVEVAGGRSTVVCACGETAAYQMPVAGRRLAPAVEAVIAAEHRVDRGVVKVDQSAAAIAVACPSCNAPLEVNETSKFLTCAYCHTTSRIPDRTWFRISGKDPHPEPIWLRFGGPSTERQELSWAEQKLQDKRRSDQAARGEPQQQAEREQQRADQEEEARRARERRRRWTIVGGMLAVPVVGMIAFAIHQTQTDPLTVAEAACEAHDPEACDAAGARTSDRASKRRRYESACDGMYGPGCTHRGRLAEDDREYPTAEDYYNRACMRADPKGCDALDALYTSGKATPKDPPVVARYYEKSCNEKGDVNACASAGIMYTESHGVTPDKPRSAGLFKKACDANNAVACGYLGRAYEWGDGIPKDESEMLRTYQKACSLDAASCFDLGRVYQNGIGVRGDDAKATELLGKACAAHSQPACAELYPNSGSSGGPAFDRNAAFDAVAAVKLSSCKRSEGPTGNGHMKITFETTGTVSSVDIDTPPFAGTAVGSCIAGKYQGVKIPAFAGRPVVTGKGFTLD